jgi:uncharacterized protein YkwD
LKHASFVLVLVLLGFCGVPMAVAAPQSPENRMVEKINAARASEAGLPALRASPDLERSAGAFAHWLVRHEQLRHRPTVSTNRSYPHSGEALALHFSLQAQVAATLGAWLKSPAHRGLVLTTSMNLVGVGHARGRLAGRPRTVWVIQVARR